MSNSLRVVLCEKPSVARDIARYLKANQKREGYFEGNGWAVTWAFGHLLELKDPHEYRPEWKSWRIETLPMIPESFELRPRGDSGVKAQLGTIKKLFKEASEIICATDAGREGELIFRYIQAYAGATQKTFRRLWVSSLTAEALAQGFQKLLPGTDFDPLYRAARCRSEADWIVGLNATRYFTVLHGGGQQLWSLGRVQTPVLAMVVERDQEIAKFEESDFWEVHTIFQQARLRHVRGRIDREADAKALVEKVAKAPLKITDSSDKEELVRQPYLYDLTELQKDLNRRFGMSADQTLKAAQSLYEKKHLTYPRTDSKFLTKDIAETLPELFGKLKALRGEEISKLDLTKLDFSTRTVNDLKVTDHHAIIPTSVIPNAPLSNDEENVYDAVLTRLIAAFYPPGKKRVFTVKGLVLDEEFKGSGSVTLDLGWEVLYPKKAKKETRSTKRAKADGASKSEDENATENSEEGLNAEALAKLKVGDEGAHAPEIKTLKTKAPLPFTEGTLLQMMETAGRRVSEEELRSALKDRGLGTPATRASIIETLLSRGYLERKKKNIVSTELGKRLISLVDDRRLKSPELTGEWESRLKQIEKDNYDPSRFMSEVIQYTREVLGQGDGSKGLGPCPLCEAPVIEGNKAYGCSKWKEGCAFRLYKDFSGASISPIAASQLLKAKRSSSPMQIMQDGKASFVILELKPDGSLHAKECEAPATSNSEASSFGSCPRCKGAILDTPKAYGCANWRQGCKFAIWKSIAKKKISQKVAKELLKSGQTELIEGFKSKSGQEFSARLVIKDFEVKFEFEKRAESPSKS